MLTRDDNGGIRREYRVACQLRCSVRSVQQSDWLIPVVRRMDIARQHSFGRKRYHLTIWDLDSLKGASATRELEDSHETLEGIERNLQVRMMGGYEEDGLKR